MGYTTYLSGVLQFDRSLTDEEVKTIQRLFGRDGISDLSLEEWGDPNYVVGAEGETRAGEDIPDCIRKLCQESENLGPKLNGQIYLNGEDDDDHCRIQVANNQVKELFARIVWEDSEWFRLVMEDLEKALSKPPGTDHINQALQLLKEVFK